MSIFQIKRIPLDQAHLHTEKKVSTVNFYSDPKTNLAENIPGLSEYLDTRSHFLSLCYQAAKELKVKEGQNFDDSTATQLYMQEWLAKNSPETPMISGTEFGLITTKLQESVKSIEKNKYITELVENIKLYLFKQENRIDPEISKKDFFKNKTYKDQLKFYYPSIDDIDNLSESNLSKLFNYELLEQSTVIKNLLQKISQEYDTFETVTIEKTNSTISSLESKLTNIWNGSIIYAKDQLKKNPPSSPTQLIESFVLSLYFKFDIDCRKVEDIYTPDINLGLNKIAQNFGNHIIELHDLQDNDSKFNLKSLWNLDWTKENSTEQFFKLLKKITDQQFEKKDEPSNKEYSWRISHPKSAPSFPKKSDSLVTWKNEARTSTILEKNQNEFSSLHFMDYLIKKSLGDIKNNEAYKVYNFVNKINYTPYEWLLKVINNSELPNFDINIEKIKVEVKQRNKKIDLTTIQFCYDKNSVNKRLPSIKTVKNIDSIELVKKWISKRYNDTIKLNPEIYLLSELLKNGVINNELINSWSDVVLSVDGVSQKLEFKTDLRITTLENNNFAHSIDANSAIDFINQKLKKIEKHLLLDNDHKFFAISDYAAFKKYQRFSESGLQGMLDKSILKNQKYYLSEIKKDFIETLAIKIDRMTATKPQGKSTLIFEITDSKVNLSKGYAFIYPIKINNGIDTKLFDNLDRARKFLSQNPGKLYAGFLNGSKDHFADKEVVELIKTDGTPGRYQQYLERKLIDTVNNINYIDKFRPSRSERLAGTNPSGYPKLYYFCVPENCANLMIPVEVNKYYLKKYTPYHTLEKYLRFEKELCDSSESEKKPIAQQILELRSYLRYYYSISSIEIDLHRKYYVFQDPESKEKSIKSKVSATIHTQYQNPIRNKTEHNSEYKPKHILSIDLGEKLLASATLGIVSDEDLEPILHTFLPIKGYDDSKKGTSGFKEVLKQIKNSNSLTEIKAKNDDSFQTYNDFANNYKKYQKRIGKTSEKLRNKRVNLSESYSEQIASQIVKLANEYNATIVFEDLSAGFGRKDTIQIYKQVKDKVINLLEKVGKIEIFTNSYRSNYFAEVAARYTSKKCSRCRFIPIINSKYDESVEIVDQWKDNGSLKFLWQNKIILEINDTENNVQILDQTKDITGETKTRVHFFTNKNKQIEQINLYEYINKKLYSSKTNNRISTNISTHKLLVEKFLNPRQSQDQFKCPNCAFEKNADYNASVNIGQKYLDKINADDRTK